MSWTFAFTVINTPQLALFKQKTWLWSNLGVVTCRDGKYFASFGQKSFICLTCWGNLRHTFRVDDNLSNVWHCKQELICSKLALTSNQSKHLMKILRLLFSQSVFCSLNCYKISETCHHHSSSSSSSSSCCFILSVPLLRGVFFSLLFGRLQGRRKAIRLHFLVQFIELWGWSMPWLCMDWGRCSQASLHSFVWTACPVP